MQIVNLLDMQCQADPVLGMDLPVHTKNENPGKSIPRYGLAGGILSRLHRLSAKSIID